MNTAKSIDIDGIHLFSMSVAAHACHFKLSNLTIR